ncbi:MAG: ATP-binding protein [Proteobacteria bacterium]|nr:ATP-binding protein [Pseudomonadota bacterium]
MTITNFRALRQIDVHLRQSTVLIGANNTGKTSFLDAVSACVQGDTGFSNKDCWHEEGRSRPDVAMFAGDACFTQGIWRRPNNRVKLPAMSLPITRNQPIRLPVQGPKLDSTGVSDLQGPPDLHIHGVATLLDYLLRRDRQRFDAFEKSICQSLPGVQGIDIATPQPQTRRVDFKIEGGYILDGNRASAGARILLFFMALAYHPTPPPVVMIEEPENGIHPQRLQEVMTLLRALSVGKYGGVAPQLLISTHSPYVLDEIDPRKDMVLVFERKDDGSCTAQPVDEKRLENFLQGFMLGEVWYSRGEAGLVPKK